MTHRAQGTSFRHTAELQQMPAVGSQKAGRVEQKTYLADILKQPRHVRVAGDEVGERDGQDVEVDPQSLTHLRVQGDLLEFHKQETSVRTCANPVVKSVLCERNFVSGPPATKCRSMHLR